MQLRKTTTQQLLKTSHSCRLKHVSRSIEGWANRTFLVNQQIVFRFPKHQVAAHDLVREIRLLTELAPTVPLPIPQYLYYGQPTQHYPFVFGGYAFIEGTPLNQCSPEVQSASWWQPPLGAFLTALHRFPIDRVQDLFEIDVYTTSQAWQEGITKMHGNNTNPYLSAAHSPTTRRT